MSILTSALHGKGLPELKAFSENLLQAIFLTYAKEMCDIVPSSENAKYSWGNSLTHTEQLSHVRRD